MCIRDRYREGRHYYNATRRDEEDLVAAKATEEFKKMLPDAVSCVVIWNPSDDDEKSGHEPCLLMKDVYKRQPLGSSSPEDTVTQIYAEQFADEVDRLSDGKMKISVYPNSVLGGDRELLESCKDGDIPFVVQNLSLIHL